MIISIFDSLLVAVNKVISEMSGNGSLIKAMILALNNIIFSEFGTDMEDKSAEELFGNLKKVIESTVDVTVVAALNIMCKLADSNETLKKAALTKNAGLEMQLQTLKANKNKDISLFASDLLGMLSP